MEERSLIKEIMDAFPNVPYPEEVAIELESPNSHPETSEAKAIFFGKVWTDIPDSMFLRNCPSPFLIGSIAFQYYLPAFMLAAIRHSDELIVESLIENLKPPKKKELYRLFTERFDRLSNRQRSVVVKFLLFLRDKIYTNEYRQKNKLNDMISRYWGNPEDTRFTN